MTVMKGILNTYKEALVCCYYRIPYWERNLTSEIDQMFAFSERERTQGKSLE